MIDTSDPVTVVEYSDEVLAAKNYLQAATDVFQSVEHPLAIEALKAIPFTMAYELSKNGGTLSAMSVGYAFQTEDPEKLTLNFIDNLSRVKLGKEAKFTIEQADADLDTAEDLRVVASLAILALTEDDKVRRNTTTPMSDQRLITLVQRYQEQVTTSNDALAAPAALVPPIVLSVLYHFGYRILRTQVVEREIDGPVLEIVAMDSKRKVVVTYNYPAVVETWAQTQAKIAAKH